jgi:uncharacterized membrane protein YfcA
MLALMAAIVPIQALVPLHGVVQLGSNTGRAALLARSARWRMLATFVAGSLAGVIVGALIVRDVQEAALRSLIGVFVLWTTWARLPALGGKARIAIAAGGAVSSVLTMFVGATGPFVIALLRQAGLDREPLVATHAVAMLIQHGMKIVAFGVLGFAFTEWLGLLAAMLASGFLGTYLGTRLLKRMPADAFRMVLKWILTAIGIQLLVTALWPLLFH